MVKIQSSSLSLSLLPLFSYSAFLRQRSRIPAEIPQGISSQNYRRLKGREIPICTRWTRREETKEMTTRGYEREVMRSVRPEAIERYNWPEVTIPRRWSTNRYDTMVELVFEENCVSTYRPWSIVQINRVSWIDNSIGNFNNLYLLKTAW